MTGQTHLHWFDGAPLSPTGTTVGVPWPRGVLAGGTAVCLCSAAGERLPTQAWPLAFWPDGSVKWLGVAAVVGPDDGGVLTVEAGDPPRPPTPVRVTRLETAWQVDTGAMREMQTSTSCAAQWSLNVIECLALIGDQIPEAGAPTSATLDCYQVRLSIPPPAPLAHSLRASVFTGKKLTHPRNGDSVPGDNAKKEQGRTNLP